MQIVRPRDGFKIVISPAVAQMVDAAGAEWPRFQQYWSDILDHLRFVAHREGVLDERLGPGHRIFVSEGSPEDGLPRVCLVYRPLGDTVTIKVARIS